MSKPSEEEVYGQATHVKCVSCQHMQKTDGLTFKNEDDLEQAYDVLFCCDDPYFEAVIISETPLFPKDDKEAQSNADFWHYGNKRYEYEAKAVLDMLED